MEFTAKQIADLIGGRIEGNEFATVNSFAKIEEGKPGAISFLSNTKYTHYIYDTQASVVIVNDDLKLEHAVSPTLIRVPNAYESVAKLMQMYAAMQPKKTGVSSLAYVSEKAEVGKDVYIAPFVYIGDGVKIGDGTRIFPNVTIYDGTQIGQRVTIHAGTVIGADGFGFAPAQDGYEKIPQLGIVVIEDDVEIGANTCIDRSTMGKTVIHRGVKLDNLIQIAHNCEVGENTVMSAQTGLAGSTKVGKWCMFGGQVAAAGHLTIGDHVNLGGRSGVLSDLKPNQTLIGSPTMDPTTYFKSSAIIRKLPELYKEISSLRREIDELKKSASGK